MRHNNLDGLTQFASVAELGSFSAAAQRLGISPSAVSQAISGLEHRLGVPLFNRTTRSVSLTEAGTEYFETVVPALDAIVAAEDHIGRSAARPAGKLRLNVLRAAHMIVLEPILGQFLMTYPDVDVEVVIDVGLSDIVRDRFDAGIRFGDVIEQDMVSIPVGPALVAHIVAAPSYLAANGTPLHPSELANHDCIGFRHIPSGLVERWEFLKGAESLEVAPRGRLIFNDSATLVQSAIDGLGITYMINGYIEPFLRNGSLVRILEDWSPKMASFRLYYPNRRRAPAKLRALISFLQKQQSLVPPATEATLSGKKRVKR